MSSLSRRSQHDVASTSAGPLARAAGAALISGIGLLNAMPAAAAHTPLPSSVTVAGSMQSELGCPGDWQPECSTTRLTQGADTVWRGAYAVPAGSWEYKAALNAGWDENYGVSAQQNGANIQLNLAGGGRTVRFYYDHGTHWITDDVDSRIVTAAGSFQSELGCAGDWDPTCLRSWLQDPDGDGLYVFETDALPAGSYETKAALFEGWNENYGAGGTQNGANIGFTVGNAGDHVRFTFASATNLLSITVGGSGDGTVPVPGTAPLALLALAAAAVAGRRARSRA